MAIVVNPILHQTDPTGTDTDVLIFYTLDGNVWAENYDPTGITTAATAETAIRARHDDETKLGVQKTLAEGRFRYVPYEGQANATTVRYGDAALVRGAAVTEGTGGNHYALTGLANFWDLTAVEVSVSSGTGSADVDIILSRTDTPATTASSDIDEHHEFFEAVDLSGGTGLKFFHRTPLSYVDDDATGEFHFYLIERVAGSSPVYTVTARGQTSAGKVLV